MAHETPPKTELNEDDKLLISEIFEETITPKLKLMHARVGTLNCEFAGERYSNWIIHFRSAGPGFRIVEFEYDRETAGLDLNHILPGKPQ